MKIQNTFVTPIAIAESLSSGVKTNYNKPSMRRSNDADAGIREEKNTQFLEEWRVDFLIYWKECKEFDEQWVKAYALIWGKYCSRDIQVAMKEMSYTGKKSYTRVAKN